MKVSNQWYETRYVNYDNETESIWSYPEGYVLITQTWDVFIYTINLDVHESKYFNSWIICLISYYWCIY